MGGGMRILYIATDNPAVDTILSGMDSDTLAGLPAFYYPFKMLLDRGHTIDLLLFTPEKRRLVESEHFKKENLIQIHPGKGISPGVLDYALRISAAARRLMKERTYDFVYGMGEGSHLAVRQAAKRGIPCGLRQYGTQEMANVLEQIPNMAGRRWTALKDYTYILLSMMSRKTFLLATNDGSRADELYDILGIRKKKYRFFFWRSGVYIPDKQPAVDYEAQGNYPQVYDSLSLSMISRITEVKRQDRAARILGELHKRGYPFHLYLVGTDGGQAMHQTVVEVGREYGISEYIHFVGGKSQKDCWLYAKNSFATLLTCEWNRLNIFYEVMGEGAVVLTNNNHSIDEFIEDGVNCLLYEENDFAMAAEKIIELMDDNDKIKAIRTAAFQTAAERFLSLDKRFGMEVRLVEDSAGRRSLSRYPKVL